HTRSKRDWSSDVCSSDLGGCIMLRRSAGLVLAVLATAAPLAAQRIRLPAKLSELETRARQDSNDAAAQYNVALGYWNDKRWDDRSEERRVGKEGRDRGGL